MRQSAFRTWIAEPLALRPQERGTWIRIVATGFEGAGRRYVSATLQLGARMGQRVFLAERGRGRFTGVLFTPGDATSISLEASGGLEHPDRAGGLAIRRIGTASATFSLFLRHPEAARVLFRSGPTVRPASLKRRLNEMAGRALARGHGAGGYRAWCELFASWTPDLVASDPDAPEIGYLVFADGADDRGSAALTAGAIRGQSRPVRFAIIGPTGTWRDGLDALDLGRDGYVGVLGAGELPVAHATDLARALLNDLGRPAFATSDEDRLDRRGARTDPFFKPRPNHALMLSGTLSRGLWLVRRDVIDRHAPPPEDPACRHAETFRLATWLSHRRAGGPDGSHLPHVLVSRHRNMRAAAPAAVRDVVADHLEASGMPYEPIGEGPVRLRAIRRGDAMPITAIVPSTLRAAHAEACLGAILAGTAHDAFDVVVAVAQPGPLDDIQRDVADRLRARFGHVEIRPLQSPAFNFSWTVNEVARRLPADRDLLLLNDDVSPLGAEWLATMSGHLCDARVGAVGAKLLYPSGDIQHAGVILGLAGLCEHAFRNQPGATEGYGHRATLSQRLLAVTGACLLVRGRVFHALGGMDESYPSAFNDVDLCLRIDEAGHEVVFAAEACLTHHELQTYGAHHAGDRAAFMEDEIRRMQARWSAAVLDDPYYNPNLDLRPEHAFTLCIPPRLAAPGRLPAGRGATSTARAARDDPASRRSRWT